jgi:hypothetical protein
MWPGENQVNISWDFSCPIISLLNILGTYLAMLKRLNLVPFYTVPRIAGKLIFYAAILLGKEVTVKSITSEGF